MSNIISTEMTGTDIPIARAASSNGTTNVSARSPEEEVWAIQVPGKVSLRVTQNNRFGQPMDAILVIGPNKQGQQFRMSVLDREENQARCMAKDADPFLNGMLVRIDGDQQLVESTKSTDALGTDQLLDIYDLPKAKFEKRVQGLAELPLRRLAEVGESMDCSHSQITFVRELIVERYSKGGPQTTMDTGERMS